MCQITFMATTRCNNCKDFDECYDAWEKAQADGLRKEKQFKQEAWKDAMKTSKADDFQVEIRPKKREDTEVPSLS